MLHVILGEQVPKMVALQATDERPLVVAAAQHLRADKPADSEIHERTEQWLVRLWAEVRRRRYFHSVDELRMIIADTQEAGLLEKDQALFLQNVFKLTDKNVRDCMVPSDKMDALEINMPADKILQIVRDCGHTRLPVYEGNIDNIVGILNTKNLFYFFSIQNAVVLEDAIYPATFSIPRRGSPTHCGYSANRAGRWRWSAQAPSNVFSA